MGGGLTMTLFTEVNPRTFLPLEGSQTMPRTKTTTADALERQAAADSKLGDLDEQGNERLPEFNGLEPQNGHIPEGVRPSERCGTPSPLHVSCTFRDEHAGRHSWQPDPELTPQGAGPGAFDSNSWEAAGTVEGEQQPTLPGTPEPEKDEYSIPYEAQFNGADYQSSTGIAEIAERFIASTEEFAHLRGIRIRYLWKRRGGLKGGNPRLGALQKPGGLTAYALGNPTFILWLGADHCRDAKLKSEQFDALIFDLLCRGGADPEDHSAFRVVGADYEGNILTLDKFGFWHPDLREMGAHIKQMGLLDTLDDLAADEGEDAAEGDEGEATDED